MLTQANLKVAEKTLQATSPQENLLVNLPLQLVKVRLSMVADANELLALLSDPKVAPGLHTLPYPSLDTLRDRLSQSSSQGCVLVACCHNEILGLVALSFAADLRRRHSATLQWLAVSPGWQGLGIGDRLLQAALDIADN
jgi:ribosomal protein S18 acetylase RimI-like enzyme